MKKIITFLLVIVSQIVISQEKLDDLLHKLNSETIPYIYQDSLQKNFNDFIFLDAREPSEFKVSHLKNAVFVGYNKFNLKKTLKKLPKNKNAKIVVYCSLGVRSEDIAEKLKAKGYTNVFNLYGGIFEWKNNGNTIFCNGKTTENVHAFDKEWGKWLTKGIKVYE